MQAVNCFKQSLMIVDSITAAIRLWIKGRQSLVDLTALPADAAGRCISEEAIHASTTQVN